MLKLPLKRLAYGWLLALSAMAIVITGSTVCHYKLKHSTMNSTYLKDIGLTVRTEGIEALGLTIEVPYNRMESLGDYVIRNNGPHTVNGFRVIFETRKKKGDSQGQNGEVLNRLSAQIPSWIYDEDPHPWTKKIYHRVEGGAIPPGTAKYCGLGRVAQIVTENNPAPKQTSSENFPDYQDYEEIIIRLDAVMLADDGKIYGPNRNVLTRNGTYATYEQTIANHIADRIWAQSAPITDSGDEENGEKNEKDK